MLRAAADAGKLGIGVDSNQNGLHPGKVLTSMLKRVDVATINDLQGRQGRHLEAAASPCSASPKNGVGWAMDDNNKALITPEMKAAADKAAADIMSGAIKVHDYMADQKCPRSQRPPPHETRALARVVGRSHRPGRMDVRACPPRPSPSNSSASTSASARCTPTRPWTSRSRKGSIHGIVGENGAGKSTLMSILYGFYEADAGEIRVGGAARRASARRARRSRPGSAWCTSTSCWWSR